MATKAKEVFRDAPATQLWRTMETAPKDGSIILASGLNWGDGPERHTAPVRWLDCGWVDAADESMEMIYLTHWLDADKLPPPGASK